MLIPYENFVIKSNKSIDEIYTILGKNTDIKKMTRIFYETKYFEGTVKRDGFNIRILKNRSVFTPVIKGKIITDKNTTEINVTMTLHSTTITIGIICFLYLSCFFIKVYLQLIQDEPNNKFIFIFYLLPILAYCLPILVFKYEAKKAMEKLVEICIGKKQDKKNEIDP